MMQVTVAHKHVTRRRPKQNTLPQSRLHHDLWWPWFMILELRGDTGWHVAVAAHLNNVRGRTRLKDNPLPRNVWLTTVNTPLHHLHTPLHHLHIPLHHPHTPPHTTTHHYTPLHASTHHHTPLHTQLIEQEEIRLQRMMVWWNTVHLFSSCCCS